MTNRLPHEEGIAYAGDHYVGLGDLVIPIDDRAHNFGDGIYEVVRVYNGRPFALAYHMERFARSAREIDLVPDRSLEALASLIEEAIQRSGLREAQVYLQLSRGVARREHAFPSVSSHLTLTVRPLFDEKFQAIREIGQRVTLAEDIRWQWCHIKSLNLLPNVLTKQRALDAGFHDALFVRDGLVTEGTSSNVAIVKDGVIRTHPLSVHILHGITRRIVLEMCADLGIPVEEHAFTVEELLVADEAFTMSTIVEIAPIREVDGHVIGPQDDTEFRVVRMLQRALQQRILLETH